MPTAIRIAKKSATEVTLERKCPFCGKTHSITVPANELWSGLKMREADPHALIQNCFPKFTPSQREFLQTGICDECWENM